MSSKTEIKTASINDTTGIAEIEKICFSVPWSENAIIEFIESPLSQIFVAKVADIIVGYIGLYAITDEADITNVAVIPDFRKQGIAKALINHTILYSKENNIKKLMLEVRASNVAAINLYTSFGFVHVGTRKNYYTQPKEDALLMDLTI